MKKLYLLLLFLLCTLIVSNGNIYAQLTGIKTIPGDYTSISAAITDLNTVGVGSGGVTFNIAAGYTETAGNLVITASGTSSNQIIFKKNGTGANPLITAGTGIGTMDGIIKLSGADYVTFDGIDLLENPLNTTTTTQMEWGFALLKVDGTNGSQNNTIKNCVISLNKINTATYGVYSANHTILATTSLTVTDRSGSNSNNKINSNIIQNCYSGIWMGGFNDLTVPYNFYDHGNEIGVGGGNVIRLFGGGSAITYGIYTIYQDSLGVNNNDIGGGTGGTSTNYGIMISTATNASVTVYNNTVSDTTAATTSATYGIALSNAGVTGTDNTVIVKRNTVTGMHATAITTGVLYGYYIYYTVSMNLYVDSNKFVDNKWGTGLTTNTGTMYGLYIYPYTLSPTVGSNEFITNNYIKGNTRKQSVVGSGIYYGMYIYYGQANVTAYNNIMENDTVAVTTSTCYGIYVYNYYSASASYYNNIVRNIYKNNGSTGAFYGIYVSNAAYNGTHSYYNNSVYNITNGFSAAALYGHYNSSSAITKNIYDNSAYNIHATMGGAVYGLFQSSGSTVNLYRNSVYNLRTSTGFGYGIYVSSGTTNNIHNNYVSDIRSDSLSSTLAVTGLYLAGGTTNNVYYNTVYLNASSHISGLFGSAALYSSTTPTLDLRNNILVNMSTPGTLGGYTMAYGRNANALTTYANTSNNNNFYAGVPDTTRIIFFDGGNYARTLNDFKLIVGPRDGFSVTENPPFVNVSTRPYDLHINAAIATQLESNGTQIAGYTTDADGQSRYPNAGYPINPSYPPNNPDIGADEFGGIPKDAMGPMITYSPLNHTQSTAPRTLTATIQDASGVPVSGIGLPRLYWRINSGSFTGVTATSLGNNQYSFTFGSGVSIGDIVQYYVCAQDNTTPDPNVSVFPAQGAAGFTANPPAVSTPPVSPSFYYIAQAGLAGDYTVGTSEFNRVTGKNITFNKVIEKVFKQVFIEDPANTDMPGKDKEITDETSASVLPKGKFELREVEEVKWIPMENGREYTGPLYVKKVEEPSYPYPMGIEGIYATLTAAIADYNIRGVSGATRFLLTDASYSTGETFPLQINVNNDMKPTATNTFTIKPAVGVNATISGSSTGSQIFRIQNNNYITIDGSNILNGTTRNLTVQNTALSTPQVILVGSTGTTPITNITVKNCNLINGTNSSSAMVVSDGALSGTAGYFNNITVQNNSFGLSYIALYTIAVMSPGNGSGLTINGNNFGTETSAVRLARIYVQGVDGATVSNNIMGNDSNGIDASNITGIWFATGTINSTISNNVINEMRGYGAPRGIAVSSAMANSNINITGNTISGIRTSYSAPPYGIQVFSTTSGVNIRKNKISNLRNFSTSGYGARGININTTLTPANIEVSNNFVWDVIATSDASVTYWGIGIAVDATGSNFNVYANSVNLFGSYPGYSSGTIHTAFYVSSAATLVNVRDNIFVSAYDNLNRTTDKSEAIYSAAANTAYTDINFNDYHAYGTTGVLGYLGADKLTLADWRTATTKDLNSISANPLFFDDNNLHIDSTQTSPVSNAGVYIASVPDDIDGQARSLTTPDIGADEGNFSQLTPPPPPALSSPANNATGQPYASLNLVWFKSATAVSYRVQVSTNAGFTNLVVNDSTVTDSIKTVTGLNPLTQYWWRVNAKNAAGTSTFSTVFTFTTMPLPPAVVNLKVVPGGFYNTSTGKLNMRDTLRVYLVDSATCQRVDSNKVVLDSITFSAPLSFTNAETGSYYIYIYHRNHIPIASRIEQNIVRGSTVSYDFTTDSMKTFGANAVKVSASPVVWAMIPGDGNKDEFVDALDQVLWINLNGLDGYLAADFNGDLFVDGLDQILWITYNGMSSYLPCPTLESLIRREILLNDAKRNGIILTLPENMNIEKNKNENLRK